MYSCLRCRRLTFTPDGQYLLAPTGIHRPQGTGSSSSKMLDVSAGARNAQTTDSYCTHVFARSHLSTPCLSLVGLEEPSVAVRCCPRPLQLVHGSQPLLPGDYRFVFAVATTQSVYVYDTQHAYPLAKLSGQHLAPINDVSWSQDGRSLAACSSDGYVTFVRFAEGALGEISLHLLHCGTFEIRQTVCFRISTI